MNKRERRREGMIKSTISLLKTWAKKNGITDHWIPTEFMKWAPNNVGIHDKRTSKEIARVWLRKALPHTPGGSL